MQFGRCVTLLRAASVLTAVSCVGMVSIHGCGADGSSSGTGGQHAKQSQGSTQGALGAACLSDRNCTAENLICDLNHNICVDCLSTADCSTGRVCVDGVCAPVSACTNSADCRQSPDTPICDNGRCVECARDVDCAGLGNATVCVRNLCRTPCSIDDNCPPTHYCGSGACLPTVCFGGRTKYCLYDQLMTCDKQGAGFSAQSCIEGCDASNGEPHCVNGISNGATGGWSNTGGDDHRDTIVGEQRGGGGGLEPTGGSREPGSGAGGSSGTGGSAGAGGTSDTGGDGGALGDPPSCLGDVVASGDPCDTIPQFGGTQVVDGVGDEFCDIPAKVIDLSNAGYKDPSSVQDTATQATIRVAWSSTALHAHVHVKTGSTGSLAQGSPNLYDGDNVQFFLSGSKPDGGAEGTSQVFIGPPVGSTPAKSNLANGSATYDWSARAVAGGYEVEFRWPWSSSGASVSTGNQIGLYLLIGVSGTSGREVEYGFALGSASSSACSSQGKPPQAWCDSMLWCAPTLQ